MRNNIDNADATRKKSITDKDMMQECIHQVTLAAVVFAEQYEPRLGVVSEIREELTKPVVVNLWKPRRGSRDLVTATFAPSSSDNAADQRSLSLAKIRLTNLRFREDGTLSPDSQTALRKVLRKWRRRR